MVEPIFDDDDDDERSEELSRHKRDDDDDEQNAESPQGVSDDDHANDEEISAENTHSHQSPLRQNHHTAKQKKSDIELHLKLNRRRMIVVVTVLVLAVGSGIGWKLRAFSRLNQWYNGASVTLTVLEKDSHKPLSSVAVAIDGVATSTSEQGIANLVDLKSGVVSISLKKEGFTPKTYTTTLYRGLNPLPDAIMEKAPDKLFDLVGTVTDTISSSPLAKVRVTIGGKEGLTDTAGTFKQAIKADIATVHIARDGYEPQDVTPVFVNEVFEPLHVALMPIRYIIFEQEKGGKTDLYQTDLKGTQATAITNGKGTYSSSDALVSPDQKWVAFLTDRDGAKVNDTLANKLYVLDQKGVTIKISDDSNPRFVRWINNSNIAYVYQTNTAPAQDSLVIVNVDSKKRTVLLTPPAVSSGIVLSVDAYTATTDGKTLYYAANSYNPNSTTDTVAAGLKGIFSVKADGSNVKRLSSPSDFVADLYLSKSDSAVRYTTSGTETVTKEITVATGVESVATSTVRERAFAQKQSFADASSITVQTKSGLSVYIDTKNGKTDCFVVNADGSNDKQLTSLGTVKSITLSPDDQYVLVSTLDGGTSAEYIVGVAGGSPVKLTDSSSPNAQFAPKVVVQ